MGKAIKFIERNFNETLSVIENVPEYRHLLKKVKTERARVMGLSDVRDMYEYFLKFKSGENKHKDEFSFLIDYGILPNEDIAEYLEEHFFDEINKESMNFVEGNVYTNNEISVKFKCAFMGGIRRSKATNSLVLFAVHQNPLYDDKWVNGVLNYTGMGTVGDQSIDFAQNKTISESRTNGVKMFLFESYRQNEYYYCGQVELVGEPFYVYELDSNEKMRKVVKFPIRRINDLDGEGSVPIKEESLKASENIKLKAVKKQSEEEIRIKAKLAGTEVLTTKTVISKYVDRNQNVALCTKIRAKGVCDLCGKEAPFKDKEGNPYLESHHVKNLKDNGPDTIYNTVALCPNCHRKVHVLSGKYFYKSLLNKIEEYIKNEPEELVKFNELKKELIGK